MVTYLDVKKGLLRPWTEVQRRRSTVDDPFGRAMLELHYFRPTIFRFIDAVQREPQILHTALAHPGEIVVDVGAYRGEWAEAIATRYGVEVYAFEPVHSAYRRLCDVAQAVPGIHPLEMALGRTDGEVTFALDGPGSAATGSPGAFGTTTVAMRDVDAVLRELGLTEIAWLKVNIEGGEYDLFDRLLETGWMAQVRTVSVQFHEWLPHAHRRRWTIRRGLRATHRLAWDYPWVWELWERNDVVPMGRSARRGIFVKGR